MSDKSEAAAVPTRIYRTQDDVLRPDVLAQAVTLRNEIDYHRAAMQSAAGQVQALLATELLQKRNKPLALYDVCLGCGVIFLKRTQHTCPE